MNVVVMCGGKNHRKVIEILEGLRQQGLPARAVLSQRPAGSPIRLKHLIRRWWEKRWMRKSGSQTHMTLLTNDGIKPEWRHRIEQLEGAVRLEAGLEKLTIARYCRRYGIACRQVPDLNGEESVQALQAWETDLLIFAGVPIIRRPVLEVPRRGTLNVHMGLLPFFRGKHVAEWSVYLDGPVGVSVHLVDPGVDTGDIVFRQPIDVDDCRSIRQMRRKISTLQHGILARTARQWVEGRLEPIPQTRDQGKQFFAMHPRLRMQVEQKLQAGYQPRFTLETMVNS